MPAGPLGEGGGGQTIVGRGRTRVKRSVSLEMEQKKVKNEVYREECSVFGEKSEKIENLSVFRWFLVFLVKKGKIREKGVFA